MATPGTETSAGRIRLVAMSLICDGVIFSAAICSSSTGTDDASNTRIFGGVVPVGICLITVCDKAVTCACAAAMSVPGWK